jgi:hypothetical protein
MRYNLDSTLPINAFSPRGGRSPFALGMTLEGGGPAQWVEDAVSSVGDAVESVGNAVGDVGVFIDENVTQPAVQDPVGTAVKIAAIAAAPATGGTSLYAIPAYAAAKGVAAGLPIEDVAFRAAVSAAATAAGVEVGDYIGTMAEFGTDLGSQQTAMLAAQNVGIGTGSAVSTTAGQVAGGAVSGGVAAGATGGDIRQGLLGGAINAGIGAGVGATVDAGAGLLNQTNTGSTQMEDWLLNSGYYDNPANIDTYTPPTAADFSPVDYGQNSGDVEAQAGGFYGGAAPVNPYTNMSDAELTAALASQNGSNTSTAMNLIKQYGAQAVKALLGGAGTAAQRSALGLGPSQGGLLGAGANYFLNQSQLGRLNTAYNQNVAGQQAATKTAQEQASFTPVGMTTAFGQSNFQYDPNTGKLISAGYTPTSQVSGQVQNLFGMGAQALPTTTNTQDIQQQYIEQQRGLLAPSREQQLASLRNRQYQRGTGGLATGGTMAGYAPNAEGLMATNPELAAYYNSLAQQDAQLAANAPTYAQNQLNAQIATGTGLFGAANTLEGYAQQPLSLSTALGTAGATAGAKAGYYGLLGNQSALATQLQGQQANIYGQGAALGSVVNPLATAASQGLGTVLGNWLS